MDTWGFLLIIVGATLYFATKKEANPNYGRAGIFIAGVGTGIVVAAVWAIQIVQATLP
jgi:Na+/phosphate symporter